VAISGEHPQTAPVSSPPLPSPKIAEQGHSSGEQQSKQGHSSGRGTARGEGRRAKGEGRRVTFRVAQPKPAVGAAAAGQHRAAPSKQGLGLGSKRRTCYGKGEAPHLGEG
jgi:hypothetical protein